MSKVFKSAVVIIALGCLVPGVPAPAVGADAKPIIGTLTCDGKGTVGLILGSEEALSCTYKPVGNGPVQAYSGTITKLGLDIGVTGKTVMVWTIFGSSSALPPGALAGEYTGASTDAVLGVGVGANVLIGGSSKSIVLQPLSLEAEEGVNFAVAIAELKLQSR